MTKHFFTSPLYKPWIPSALATFHKQSTSNTKKRKILKSSWWTERGLNVSLSDVRGYLLAVYAILQYNFWAFALSLQDPALFTSLSQVDFCWSLSSTTSLSRSSSCITLYFCRIFWFSPKSKEFLLQQWSSLARNLHLISSTPAVSFV